jgi:hypothetical protein
MTDNYSFRLSVIMLLAVVFILTANSSQAAPGNTGPVSTGTSFSECLHTVITGAHAATTLDTIGWYTCNSFTPAIETGTSCLVSGVLNTRPLNLDLVMRAYGYSCEPLIVLPSKWKRSFVRDFYYKEINDSLMRARPILAKGGWNDPAGRDDWMIVSSLTGNKVKGRRGELEAIQDFTPSKLFILSATNSSAAPGVLRDKMLALGVAYSRNTAGIPGIITGAEAIQYLADKACRRPGCLGCPHTHPVCIRNVISLWRRDALSGIRFLEGSLEAFPDMKRSAVHKALQSLKEYAILLEVIEERITSYDPAVKPDTWAACAESIRSISVPVWEFGNALAPAVSQSLIPYPRYAAARYHSPYKSRKLVRSLPNFQDLEDGSYSFLSSGLMAAQVMKLVVLPQWLKGLSGHPFKFMMDTNSYIIESDLPGEIDLSHAFFSAARYRPGEYVLNGKESQRTLDVIRREIVKAINRREPILGYNIAGTNAWGLIVGYDAHGELLLSRSPSDTGLAFNITYTLPERLMFFSDKLPVRSNRAWLKTVFTNALVMYEHSSKPPYLAGLALLKDWERQLRFYDELLILPPVDFARANHALWLDLHHKRRTAYQFIELAARKIPDVQFPLKRLYNIYIQEATILNNALKDNLIIGEKDGIITPHGIKPVVLGTQADLLKKIITLEEEAAEEIREVIKEL